MHVDLRVKHDIEARRAAIGLFERGYGSARAARALAIPRNTVRQWLYAYRSFGSEVLLSMDRKQARCTYEQKAAAASAVVDGGMSRQDAMREFGIMSLVPLNRWCRLYREGGESAQAQAEGQAEGVRIQAARTGARGALPKARGRGGVSKENCAPWSRGTGP